jgi:hypothetical protein
MNHTSLFARSMILALGVILFAACTPAAPIATQVPPIPTPLPPTAAPIPATAAPAQGDQLSPSPRWAFTMAYDSKRDQVVLFGGSTVEECWENCPPMNGETWIYDVAANTWTEIKPPTAPRGRAHAPLAYDAESDRTIFYSGAISVDNLAPLETWSFDMNTKTWTQMKASGPANRFGHKLVYDSKADRVILWGGWNMKDNLGVNDTWAYDYNTDTWTEMKPAVKPPGVNFQGMVYDSKADRVIMWGGGFNTSVWVYDYNTDTWEERKPAGGPSSRWLHEMSYDSKADRTILYGGYTGDPIKDFDLNDYSSETWTYDYNLNTWTLLNPAGNPGPLSEFGQVYLPSTDRVLLFGGGLVTGPRSGKTWLYDYNANTWTEVTPKP